MGTVAEEDLLSYYSQIRTAYAHSRAWRCAWSQWMMSADPEWEKKKVCACRQGRREKTGRDERDAMGCDEKRTGASASPDDHGQGE